MNQNIPSENLELADLNILIHRQEDEIKQAKKDQWSAWNDAQEQKDLL